MKKVDGSSEGAVAITPSDANNIAFPSGVNKTSRVYVGVTGNLKVKMASGEDVTFANIAVGFHEIAIQRVYSTGTTATTMVALY